ncbi:MAG: hypothetical protein ACLUE2_03385 [Bacteroides cellulosilyticus]
MQRQCSSATSVWVASIAWGDASPESKIAYYLDDCMDAIEYAIGDVTTEWGAKRAEQGHPEPFPLQYVEIGNENWGDEYDKRFRYLLYSYQSEISRVDPDFQSRFGWNG